MFFVLRQQINLRKRQKKRKNNYWQGCTEMGTLHIADGNITVWPLWKTVWYFLKKLKLEFKKIKNRI